MHLDSIETVQSALFRSADCLPVISVPMEEAFGCILAEDMLAQTTQPPFRRSAMDGYALRYSDLAAAGTPGVFPVKGILYAGDQPLDSFPEGSAVRIMTGAPIPDEADVIIPQELTDYGEKQVTIHRALPQHANCIPAGEDFRKGDVISSAGRFVDAYTVAAGVAAGIKKVSVRRRIRAAVLTTGSELRDLEQELKPGQIYNSNKAYFAARLQELGCEVIMAKSVADEVGEIREMIREAAKRADLIITTGGVSVGKRDYLPEVLENLSAETIFRGISVKPGSPTTAAHYGNTTILCLSGNPYSSIAMFEILFPYYEQKALARERNRLTALTVPTVNGYPRPCQKRRLVRGILTPEGVQIPKHQRNGQLRDGIGSNCLVELPENSQPVPAGAPVKVLLI
ncbi:MAG: molybdopterin molybdotransferase MoeA [Lachnospiraceae bacterium]|nr:molybdopterin molybdotransferase MoeA [Lachnospiraceae bacterium]